MSDRNLRRIVQPLGGLVESIASFRSRGDEPRLSMQSARLRLPRPANQPLNSSNITISGTGTGWNDEQCVVPCLGEFLERYCTKVFTKEQFIIASANELGSAALDLDTLPRCSERELTHPKCRLIAPDKAAPIRWILGLSLMDGRRVYLPAVMVYLYAGSICPEERFWFPITTGCAAHGSFEEAVSSAILEIVERDAISIVWLQQLSLPLIDVDDVAPSLEPYWTNYQASADALEYHFFNATLDLGIPTIYGVQRALANKELTTLVSCSSALDPVQAFTKVMRDMVACRNASSRTERPIPDNWDDFTSIFHGARYMARSEQAHAFNFLLQSGQRQYLSELSCVTHLNAGPARNQQELHALLTVLKSRNLDAYAVDITADEALRAGVRVVQVLIPGLQPVGFQYRSRYLGHKRLYEVPKRMGYPIHLEHEINPWPQPFA
jgi:ribosomal protein S12 methylthiotransferase accessory factor